VDITRTSPRGYVGLRVSSDAPRAPCGGYFSRCVLVSERRGSGLPRRRPSIPAGVKKIAARKPSRKWRHYVDHVLERPRTFCKRKMWQTWHAPHRCSRPIARDDQWGLLNDKVRYLLLSGASRTPTPLT